MADDVQRPQESSRPAAALVVVSYDMARRRVTETRKQRGKALVVRQLAGGGFYARNQLGRLYMAGARNMHTPVSFRLAEIDDQQGIVSQMSVELSRFYDEGKQC